MSWDSYIDNLIGHTKGSCDRVAIIGQDGSQWTTQAHPNALKITTSESTNIGPKLKAEDFTTFQANGIHLEGTKYQFLRASEGIVLGKKKDFGAVTLQKSKTAVVIGHTKEGGQQGDTNKGVSTIAEYLISLEM